MTSVCLALRKHDKRLSSRIIQWWTRSIYSHCELVVGGVCYSSSAMDGGVRRKNIDLDPGKWDVIELSWASAENVVAYFCGTDHHRYGWRGLIFSQLFNLNRAVDGAQFCSQWCASAVGIPNPATYSPASLEVVCRFIGEKLLSLQKTL